MIGTIFHKLITKEILEQQRTPRELYDFCLSTFEQIKSKKEEIKRARLRKGVYKKFIEEIYPISIFCRWKYPENNVQIKPALGNQGYDAKVISCGKEVGFIEITWPIDGQRNKEQCRLLNERGYGDSEVCDDPLKKAKEVMARVLKKAKQKALRDYRGLNGATLVMLIDVFPHFYLEYSDHREEFDNFIAQLKQIKYLANSVYIVLMPKREVIPIIEG